MDFREKLWWVGIDLTLFPLLSNLTLALHLTQFMNQYQHIIFLKVHALCRYPGFYLLSFSHPTVSHMFGSPVSLGSSWLWQFRFSLSLMTLIVRGQVFCRISSNWDWSFSHGQTRITGFWEEHPRGKVPVLCHIKGKYYHDLLLLLWTLATWLR